MSVQAIGWVLDNCPPNVPVQGRMVLVSIANHANGTGENSYPGVDTIKSETGLDNRQVQRWVRWLEEHGIVEVELQAGGDHRTRADRRPNRYTIVPLRDGASSVSPRPEGVGDRQRDGRDVTPAQDDGVTSTSPGDDTTGCHSGSDGVTSKVARGGVSVTQTKSEPTTNRCRAPGGARVDYPSTFETTWQAFPRKLAKKAAFKAWRARLREGLTADQLHEATVRYAASVEGQALEYVMHGATFFGANERWADFAGDAPAEDRGPQVEDWMRHGQRGVA